MKHLAKITTMLMLLLAGFSFTACDDDEKVIDSPIVGVWRCDYSDGYELAYFNADGTGRFVGYEDGEYSYTDAFTFAVYGDILTIIYEDGDSSSGPFTIEGNLLDITAEETTYYRVS